MRTVKKGWGDAKSAQTTGHSKLNIIIDHAFWRVGHLWADLSHTKGRISLLERKEDSSKPYFAEEKSMSLNSV